MSSKGLTGLATVLSMVVSSSLLIADISVTDIDGNWTSVTGGTNVSGVGTNEIRWGVTNGQQSGYVFEPAPVVFSVTPDVPFDLGTFTHNNFPIFSEGITGASLTANFTLLIDGDEVSSSMVYDFTHNETPNTGPGNCCDDIVTAINNSAFSDTFFINGIEYQLNVKGFEVDGELFTEFHTKENKSNSATLIAEVNKFVPVPEPSTYLLLSSLLVAAILLRKKVVKKS